MPEMLEPIGRPSVWRKMRSSKVKYMLLSVTLSSSATSGRHAFCLMKLNGRKEEHYFNEIAPTDTKTRIEVIFEVMKVLLVCVFLI